MTTLAEQRKLFCPMRFGHPNPSCLGEACAALIFEDQIEMRATIASHMAHDDPNNVAVGNQKARLAEAGYTSFQTCESDIGRGYVTVIGYKDQDSRRVSCGMCVPRLYECP